MTVVELNQMLDRLAGECWTSDRGAAFVKDDAEEWAYQALDGIGLTTESLRRAVAREVVWRAMHLPGKTP